MQHGQNASAFLLVEEVEFLGKVSFLLHGSQQTECRIHGCVVQKLAVGKVNHAHVRRAFAHAAANAQKQQTAGHQPDAGEQCRAFCFFQRIAQQQPVEGKHAGCRQHYTQRNAQGIALRYARQSPCRVVKVGPHRAVELDAPKSVKAGVAHEYQGHNYGQQSDIYLIYKAHGPNVQP